MPGNIEADQPLEEFYALTEEQLLTMSDEARAAWALTRIQGLPETELLDSGGLKALTMQFSQLDEEKAVAANRKLVQDELVDREGFGDGRPTVGVHLSLNENGHRFLEQEVEKAKA
jgi:hypothetical protein